MLVEFASAVEAVNSAVEAQQAPVRFREEREDKASVRIGLLVGNIVHSGGCYPTGSCRSRWRTGPSSVSSAGTGSSRVLNRSALMPYISLWTSSFPSSSDHTERAFGASSSIHLSL